MSEGTLTPVANLSRVEHEIRNLRKKCNDALYSLEVAELDEAINILDTLVSYVYDSVDEISALSFEFENSVLSAPSMEVYHDDD